MEENKVTDVIEEVTDLVETPDIEFESSEGPSKGFVTLVVGGVAALAVGAGIAWKRHKKKKAEKLVVDDDNYEDEEEEELEDDDLLEEEPESEKESEKESKKK